MTLAQTLNQAGTTTVAIGRDSSGNEVRICFLENTPGTVTVYTETDFFFYPDHRPVAEIKAAWGIAA